MEESSKKVAVFEGTARVGEIARGFMHIQLRPEDLTSPLSFQMALSRIYETLIRTLQEGPKKTFVAEVRFTDSIGQNVSFAVDLGTTPPPFQSERVKAKIIVELYEENRES
ncbi:MAG: hypothetical protein QXU97_01395 [Fervidicoccaceae archaeon]